MEKLFLFGTGKISKQYTQVIKHMPIDIEGYVDNDRSKWGTQFCDRKIYAPDMLCQTTDSYILIACVAKEEIAKQLVGMNLEKRIVSFGQILRSHSQHLLNDMITSIDRQINVGNKYWEKSTVNTDGRTILIDNFYGSWGGAEDWSHIVTLSLAEKNNVFLIENKEQPYVKELEKNIIHIDTKGKDTYQIYSELTKLLMQIKPFVLFNVWNSELLWAAATIKGEYPEDVFIISSILCDSGYVEWHDWDKIIDKYICISKKIQRNLLESYKIEKEKVCYFCPFIEKIRKVNRKYNSDGTEPIKIGYPCRLVRNQKRADLIPQFIEYLEAKMTNYVLNIAGDGSCRKEIEEYVRKNHLHRKVRLYGKLSKAELIDFLNNQDIYLNFSEYEGTSLTMLEAMASGCVPVVTNVSGVSDFIASDVNGLIANVGDMEKLAEYIVYLDQNRNLLAEFGNKCMDIVSEKCRLDKYINNIGGIIESL